MDTSAVGDSPSLNETSIGSATPSMTAAPIGGLAQSGESESSAPEIDVETTMEPRSDRLAGNGVSTLEDSDERIDRRSTGEDGTRAEESDTTETPPGGDIGEGVADAATAPDRKRRPLPRVISLANQKGASVRRRRP
ncbi:MAG: hypothetical protein R2698_04875 [Microthrixaceae bacterium]